MNYLYTLIFFPLYIHSYIKTYIQDTWVLFHYLAFRKYNSSYTGIFCTEKGAPGQLTCGTWRAAVRVGAPLSHPHEARGAGDGPVGTLGAVMARLTGAVLGVVRVVRVRNSSLSPALAVVASNTLPWK